MQGLNGYSAAELAEMLELKRQIEELEQKYNAIANKQTSGSAPTAPAAPSATPAPQANVQTPPAPAATPTAPVPSTIPVSPAPVMMTSAISVPGVKPGTMSERLVNIIMNEPKPASLDKLFVKLEESGWDMPKEKAKLVVRKTLYNAKIFKVDGKTAKGQGLFTLSDEIAAAASSTEAPSSAPKPAPAPKPEPTAEPVAAPKPEPVPVPAPVPEPEPTPEPTPEPVPVPKAPPVPTTRTASSESSSIRARITTIIEEAGSILSFDEIYAGLGKDGHPLPLENSKEVIRKILANASLFEEVEEGYYSFVE